MSTSGRWREAAVRLAAMGAAAMALGAAADPPAQPELQRVMAPQPAVSAPAPRAADSVAGLLLDDELVIGVELGGVARAYVVDAMMDPSSEVWNDTVGGSPLSVTWCGLTDSARVFSRSLGGRTLELGLEGSSWRKNIVLYDSRNGTRWSQFTGRAIEGTTGGGLAAVPCVVVTWKIWRTAHPGTTVVTSPDKPAPRFIAPRFQMANQYVLGVSLDADSRAYPFGLLAVNRVLNDWVGSTPVVVTCLPQETVAWVYDRRVDGRLLVFRPGPDGRMTDDQTGSRWEAARGECIEGMLKGAHLKLLPSQPARRAAWFQFYPPSTLYTAG